MKKLGVLLLIIAVLIACKPVIFYYKPLQNTTHKNNFYRFCVLDSVEILIFPNYRVIPNTGFQCEVIIKNNKERSIIFDMDSVFINSKSMRKYKLGNCEFLKGKIIVPPKRFIDLLFRENNCNDEKVESKKTIKELDTIAVCMFMDNTSIETFWYYDKNRTSY